MKVRVLMLSLGLSGVLLMSACSVTETAQVLDDRPRVSFAYQQTSPQARVYVDGIDSGAVSQFKDNEAALRVLAGTHVIGIFERGHMIYEQKLYVADGVTQTVRLP